MAKDPTLSGSTGSASSKRSTAGEGVTKRRQSCRVSQTGSVSTRASCSRIWRPLRGPAQARRPHPGPLLRAGPARPRRADQPPRPLRQALADGGARELHRFPPAHQPRPAAVGQCHHEGPQPFRLVDCGASRELHGVPGGSRREPGAARTRVGSRGTTDRPSEGTGRTRCATAPSGAPESPSRSTPASPACESQRTVVTKRERATKFRLPAPQRSASVPMVADALRSATTVPRS